MMGRSACVLFLAGFVLLQVFVQGQPTVDTLAPPATSGSSGPVTPAALNAPPPTPADVIPEARKPPTTTPAPAPAPAPVPKINAPFKSARQTSLLIDTKSLEPEVSRATAAAKERPQMRNLKTPLYIKPERVPTREDSNSDGEVGQRLISALHGSLPSQVLSSSPQATRAIEIPSLTRIEIKQSPTEIEDLDFEELKKLQNLHVAIPNRKNQTPEYYFKPDGSVQSEGARLSQLPSAVAAPGETIIGLQKGTPPLSEVAKGKLKEGVDGNSGVGKGKAVEYSNEGLFEDDWEDDGDDGRQINERTMDATQKVDTKGARSKRSKRRSTGVVAKEKTGAK